MAAVMRVISSVAGIAGAALLTSGWIFYADDRQQSHLSMVGTLAIDLPEGRGLGTAVLVDSCGILTTAHAVFGPWYVTALRAPSHAFVATFTLTEVTMADGSHPATRATPVVWGDYRGPDRQIRHPDNDWAYLVLDRCFGAEYGHVDLRTLEPEDLEPDKEQFAAIGYSSERQMIDPGCAVRSDRSAAASGAWLHDCALLAGDSGAPILKRGTRTVVALGSGFVGDPSNPLCVVGDSALIFGWNDHCANLAVPLRWDIIERIRNAEVASGVQRTLNALGYDAGPLGVIDAPRAAAAIKEAQRDMGLPISSEPSHSLWKVLSFRLDQT